MSKSKDEKGTKGRRDRISLEEKIEIFERFFDTGENLTSKTIFEGYPIGQWGVQLRNIIKRIEAGTVPGKLPPEEQLEKLRQLGILQRRKGSSIEEKIQAMEDWMKKYPNAKICIKEIDDDIIKEYAKSDEEFEQLKEEYQKMIKYYEYARIRKLYGKLTPKQLIKCKDANIGGVFGYTCYVEDIAQIYGMSRKTVNHLINKYGSIEKFVDLFRERKLSRKDLEFAKATIKQAIDLDRDKRSANYDSLMSAIFKDYNKDLIFYSSNDLKEILKKLTPSENEVLEYRHGFESGQKLTLEKTSQELNVSRERVRQIECSAFRKLRVYINKSNMLYNSFATSSFTTDEEKERISSFFDKIKKSNAIFYTVKDPNIDEMYWDREKEFLNDLRIKVKERQEKKRKNSSKSSELKTPITQLELSNRSTNALNKAGISSLEQLVNLTGREFYEIRGIGKESVEEVVNKLIELGLCFKTEELTRLQKARVKRDGLRRKLDLIVKKAEDAKKLSDEIDEIDLQGQNQNDKKPNLDD